jgi:ABC-type multidrug transport system fused ATPase/permease subunit
MKEFLKFGIFYWKLTEGRIFIFMCFTLLATLCEAFFALSLLPLMELGSKSPGKYSQFIYNFLEECGVADGGILLPLLCLALLAITLTSIGNVAAKIYSARLQSNMYVKVQMQVCPELFNSNYRYFISKSIGFLNNAIIQQMGATAFAFKHYATVITGCSLALAYLSIPFFSNPISVGVLFIAMIPMIPILRLFNRKNREYSVLKVANMGQLNGLLLQIMGNFKYIKSTAMVRLALHKLEKDIRQLSRLVKKIAIWGDTSSFIIKPYAIAVIFGMIYYSVSYMGNTFIEAGAMFAFLYMAYQKGIVVPVSYQKFLTCIGAINVYEQVVKETAENPDEYEIDSGEIKPDFSQPITMQNISFSYNPELQPVLQNISMEIPPKKSIAIVGESGSGKSTLVNLITALLRPQEGVISLAGTEYSKLDVVALRHGVGYISQEPVVFNDSVINNITLWDEIADKENVVAVTKKAHAHDFIMQMDDDYNTLLGDNGVNISGGQRQRLSIARELFRDPPIMIFDEATSALDSATEEKIQKEIDELKGERTIIIIAHRLATIKNCDVIYVLDAGKIVEQGSYQELYDKNSTFKKMVDKQSL